MASDDLGWGCWLNDQQLNVFLATLDRQPSRARAVMLDRLMMDCHRRRNQGLPPYPRATELMTQMNLSEDDMTTNDTPPLQVSARSAVATGSSHTGKIQFGYTCKATVTFTPGPRTPPADRR